MSSNPEKSDCKQSGEPFRIKQSDVKGVWKSDLVSPAENNDLIIDLDLHGSKTLKNLGVQEGTVSDVQAPGEGPHPGPKKRIPRIF